MKYYIAQDIKLLSKQLAEDIKNSKASLFQTTKIITQTKGMNTWLEMEMADQLGIFCNYQFVGLRDVVMEVYTILGGDTSSFYAKGNMAWVLFEILGQEKVKVHQAELYQYYKEDALLRMELATKVADLFDQYQVYRPEMIDQWNDINYQAFGCNNESWQAFLWRELKTTSDVPFLDMSAIKDYIFQEINNPKQALLLEHTIKEIYLFGLSSFTAFQVDILQRLASIFPVYVYLINAAPNVYWQEDEGEQITLKKRLKNGTEIVLSDSNPLLLNWGKLTQNSFRLFNNNNDAFYNESMILDDENNNPFPATLLGKIKNSIYAHTSQAESISEADLRDKSICIASNYTIKREVESLFNYLVDTIVETTEPMKVRDILVVVSDIDAYAPYIKGIFSQKIALQSKGNEENTKETFAFKYTIADEKITNGQSVIAALQLLMELEYATITAEHIIQLLENKYINSTFEIYDVAFVKTAMNSASMRYGWENAADNDTVLVGFTKGIKRMLYGILIADEEMYDGIIPINISDNNQEFQTIVKLSYFLEKLENHLQQRQAPQSLSFWNLHIQELLDHFITDNNVEKDELYKNIFFQIKAMKEIEDTIETPIIFTAFRQHLLQNLTNHSTTHKYLNTGITFCSPIPFRSLPFKVICVLGMNYDAFPRIDKASDFDLIKKKPQFSDRNINHNDKQLFLDLVMNAEEKLYLSYIGKDIKDNSEKPPSLLIDELLDFIEISYKSNNENLDFDKSMLLKTHPLLSFSSLYNQEGSSLGNNYLIQQKRISTFSQKSATAMIDIPPMEISLKDLELFCSDTVQYYYYKVLGIYLAKTEGEMAATEKFELDNLERWIYKNELLDSAINNQSIDLTAITEKQYKKGAFPLKNLRETTETSIQEDAQALLDYVQAKKDEGFIFEAIKIEGIPGIDISGSIKYITDDKTLHYLAASKTKDKYKIKAYISFVIAKAMDIADNIVYQSSNGKLEKTPDITQETAIHILSNIIAMMEKYQSTLIPYCSEIINANDEMDVIRKIEENLYGYKSFANQYLKIAYETDPRQFYKYYEEMEEWIGKPTIELFK